jgi:digeranylgeranylglycerophospholipid reductase
MPDVHVVGAGPAGSIAAISALREGHSVFLSEEHEVPGIPRNCSGLFSKDGLETLGGFMDFRKFVSNAIHGADIDLAGQGFSVRRKDPVAYVCDRSSMDQHLAKTAESEGARMFFSQRISRLDQLRSGNIIGADGPLSFIADAFGFPRARGFASTLQEVLPYKSEDSHVIEMFISKERFPGFFAWIIPQDEDTAEFGVGVLSPAKPIHGWKHLLRMKGMGFQKPKGFIIPLRPRPRTGSRIGRRNVLLVGDAAGQVKSTTGGGVVFGGNCAALAGRHATNPLGYELAWRSRFGPDLAMHALLHGYLSSRTESQLADLGRRIKKTNLDDYLSRHGHMDKPTRMVGPAAMLHLIMNLGGVF